MLHILRFPRAENSVFSAPCRHAFSGCRRRPRLYVTSVGPLPDLSLSPVFGRSDSHRTGDFARRYGISSPRAARWCPALPLENNSGFDTAPHTSAICPFAPLVQPAVECPAPARADGILQSSARVYCFHFALASRLLRSDNQSSCLGFSLIDCEPAPQRTVAPPDADPFISMPSSH